MSQPHSFILLPPAKSRSGAPRKPFRWRDFARHWPLALGVLLGWIAGYLQGSQRAAGLLRVPVAESPHRPEDSGTAVPVVQALSATETPVVSARPAPVAVRTTVPPSVSLPAGPSIPSTPVPKASSPPQAKTASIPGLAKQSGSIRITSRPEKAEVYASEKFLGLTPLQLKDIPPGNHAFRVEKERHTRKLIETRVKAGALLEVDVELQYDPEPRTGKPFTSGHGLRMQWIPWLQGWAAGVEMTQSAYETVTHENPSEQKGPDLPVTNVTWSESMKFCDLLTIAERGVGFLPEGYAYALPSDEEWSRLAKDTPLSLAVTGLNGPRQSPSPVGSLGANGLGLHDLRGNVWEWCRDSYTAEVHRRQLVENATGDPSRIDQRYKVLRGGSWNRTSESNLGLGFRLTADGNSHSDYETGFRVILVKATAP